MSKVMKFLNKPMMAIMSRLTPSCEIVSERVSRSMDGKLTVREKVGVKIHLWGCELCKRYQKQLLVIKDMLGKYSSQIEDNGFDPAIKLSEEKKETILKILQEEN